MRGPHGQCRGMAIGCSDGGWKIPSEKFVGEEGSDVGFASGFLGRGCLRCLVLCPNEELLFVGRPGGLVAMQVWGCQVAAVRVASFGNNMASARRLISAGRGP